MSRVASSIGTIAFFFLAPATIAGLIPWGITGWQQHWSSRIAAVAGAALVAAGIIGLLESFARFALVGEGTPAPVAPTKRLVIGGFYRRVRNPMYLAVFALIVGQGLWLGQTALLLYGAALWLIFHVFVVTYEEPTLHRMFPEDYAAYTAAVGRWVPRLTPWQPEK